MLTGFADLRAEKASLNEALIVHRRAGGRPSGTLVVFVHGFAGNRYNTWGNFPKFLIEDFSDLDVGLYAYRTGLNRLRITRSISLEAEATVLADILRDCTAYSRVILLGHSMGGLLCKFAIKDLIDRDDQTTLGRLKGLFLLATPQAGSHWVPPFLSFLTNDTRALRSHGATIERMHRTFVNRITADGTSPGKVHLPVFAITASDDIWVSALSSGLEIPSSHRKVVRAAHTNIARPLAKDDDVYEWVLVRMRDLLRHEPSAGKSNTPSREDRRKSEECVAHHRVAYAEGRILESLHHISEAYRLTPDDTYVASRYASTLMRVGREKSVADLLDVAKKKGLYDDAIKGIEAEHLRRQGNPETALRILESVHNSAHYNIAYEKGMCNLLLYSQRRRPSDLLHAWAQLKEAHQIFPTQWWVTTNLAIAAQVVGKRDENVEQVALTQLEDAIRKYPLKASSRIYRLFYYVMLHDEEELAAAIASDHDICPSTMEVACDFFDTAQERVALICPHEEEAEHFMRALEGWSLRFTLLHP